MKNNWLEHIDDLIQSHCARCIERERANAAAKALESTATALTDAATYLRMLAVDLPELG